MQGGPSRLQSTEYSLRLSLSLGQRSSKRSLVSGPAATPRSLLAMQIFRSHLRVLFRPTEIRNSGGRT